MLTRLPKHHTHTVVTDASDEDSSGLSLEDISIWVAAGIGVLALVTILVIIIVCLCIRRVRANRQGFYATYEDTVSKGTMLHYTASLRSITRQDVSSVDRRVVNKEKEFYV